MKYLSMILTATLTVSGSLPAIAATETAELHDRLFTVDTHVDVPRIEDATELDLIDAPKTQVDIRKMKSGGLDAVFFIVFSSQTDLDTAGYEAANAEALARFATIRRMLDRHGKYIELATTVSEAKKIHASGKLVAFIGMENANPLAGSPENLKAFYDRGVRYLGITHMGHNDLGDSANPNGRKGEPETIHGGLTDAGRAVVAEANRLGIMVDVSHAHRDTAIEIARVSQAPVIASHSAVRALSDIPRNMDDDQLMAVKDSDGVVQVVAFSTHLKKAAPERMDNIIKLAIEVGLTGGNHDPNTLPEDVRKRYLAERAEIDRQWPAVKSSVSDLADHIDYAVGLIGIDHVGIASDFGGGGGIEGWRNAAETPNVTAELVSRGYSEADLEKLWGGNLLRVMAAVERAAGRQ